MTVTFLRTGEVGQVRHRFKTDIVPSGELIEVWRIGPLSHYLGFMCASNFRFE